MFLFDDCNAILLHCNATQCECSAMGLQRNAIATRCNPIAMPMRMQCDGAVAIGMLLQCDCNATRCDCNATALFGRRPPSSSVFPKAHGKKGGDVRGEGEGRWFLPPGPRGHEGGRRKDAIATQCDCNAMRLPRNAMRLQWDAVALQCDCNAMQLQCNANAMRCNAISMQLNCNAMGTMP